MTALPVRHLPTNAAARAIRNCVLDLMRLRVPRIAGGADAADILARRDLMESVAKIFDRAIEAILDDTAEHCEVVDRSYADELVATALRPVLDMHEEAAERWREDNGRCGVGA